MSRVDGALRRRRRRVAGAVALAAALAAGGTLLFAGLTGDEGARGSAVARAREPRLAVLAYRGAHPAVALLGTARDGDGVVVVVPGNVVASIPGYGTGRVSDAVAAGAEVLQTTVANLLGVPVRHRAVLSRAGVERVAGPEAAARLDGRADPLERVLVIEEVLGEVLRAGPRRVAAAAEQADRGFAEALAAVGTDPDFVELPVTDAGSGVAALDTARAERLMRQLFGEPGDALADVVLLNGNGVPGIGAQVARRIVPEGFRVVVSANAGTFDVAKTHILVADGGVLAAGERLRRALGVGVVSVGKERTGLGDITVVIGKDFGQR